ncbi:predicted thioesterase [Corynebacterium kutscheri]|uniref:Predicted thioesterase n=1 Tax=Corynebacterium kutscheri TaxID=35755 RepID=A0A0F6R198_9CORY|nr:acyl-CoA thioesterase [Corynebacterium kutscheri]AKE40878.1 putative thioesterase [Corynebacterium kutscheri]VEH06639.1 predicted thioesterase [Corynebacterium kutscheri]VEH09175.1 predicted thioesterase [Corynebacterium kutscheri]VEH82571.1 predicted thioesterase [Corynebacterium kutscheri]
MAEDTFLVHTTHIPLRWSDFDRFGHLSNARYIEIAQEARQIFGDEEFKERALEVPAMFVRKIDISYDRAILPNTTSVKVVTTVTKVGNTSLTTSQELFDVEDNCCAVLEAVQVVIDTVMHSPRPITDMERKVMLGQLPR